MMIVSAMELEDVLLTNIVLNVLTWSPNSQLCMLLATVQFVSSHAKAAMVLLIKIVLRVEMVLFWLMDHAILAILHVSPAKTLPRQAVSFVQLAMIWN
jgi:hypothetical protein